MNILDNDEYKTACAEYIRSIDQVVRTAILYDCLLDRDWFVHHKQHQEMMELDDDKIFEIDDDAFIFDVELTPIPQARTNRNLRPETQKIFGFQFSQKPKTISFDDTGFKVQLSLLPTELVGPHLAKNAIVSHMIHAHFDIQYNPDNPADTWYGPSLIYERVSAVQREPNFDDQIKSVRKASNLTSKMDSLDALCVLADNFDNYTALLD